MVYVSALSALATSPFTYLFSNSCILIFIDAAISAIADSIVPAAISTVGLTIFTSASTYPLYPTNEDPLFTAVEAKSSIVVFNAASNKLSADTKLVAVEIKFAVQLAADRKST